MYDNRMSKAIIGKKVPDFELPSTGGGTFSLSGFKGYRVVLYFYPKDNTPGCTREGQDFRDKIAAFSRNKTKVFGISRDSLKSHEKFKAKQKFPFELLSDVDERACRLFDVIKKKSMFGKTALGISRSTFLIDEQGVLRSEWRKVKVAGHVEEVLAATRHCSPSSSR